MAHVNSQSAGVQAIVRLEPRGRGPGVLPRRTPDTGPPARGAGAPGTGSRETSRLKRWLGYRRRARRTDHPRTEDPRTDYPPTDHRRTKDPPTGAADA